MSNKTFYMTVYFLKWLMIGFIFTVISYGVFIKGFSWGYYAIWLIGTILVGEAKIELPDDE